MKKLYVLTLCLLISVFNTFAQQNDVYVVVEEMPEFPGGVVKMNEYLSNSIVYPEYAVENNIEGRVIVEFVVNTDGTITDTQIKQSVHELLDNEALRIVKAMPRWKPAKQKGKLVRVKYTLPINFNLEIKPVFASDEERVEFFVRSHVDVNIDVEITEIQPMERFLFSIVKFRYQTPEIYEDKIEENKKIFQYIESLSNETKISYFMAQGGLSVAGRCRCLTKDSNTSIEKEGYIPYSLQA